MFVVFFFLVDERLLRSLSFLSLKREFFCCIEFKSKALLFEYFHLIFLFFFLFFLSFVFSFIGIIIIDFEINCT